MNNNDRNTVLVMFVCSLAAVQLIVSLPCQATTDGHRLCESSKKDALKLESISQLLSTSTDGCDQYVKEAFSELVKLVKLKGACTMDHAKQVTQYNMKYLATKELASKLPEELVHFALAFGMRVGKLCKEYMRVKLLGPEPEVRDESYEPKTFDVSCQWIDANEEFYRLALIRNGIVAEEQMPSDYASIFPERASEQRPKFRATSKGLVKVKETCEQDLRPIYGPIVMPIAHLVRNGLDYYDTGLIDHFIFDAKYELAKRQLSRTVLLCEVLNQLEIIEDELATDKEENEKYDDDDYYYHDDDDENNPECRLINQPESPMSMDMSVGDCMRPGFDGELCLYGHELDYEIESGFIEIDSPMEYFDMFSNVTEQFREELLRHAYTSIDKPSVIDDYNGDGDDFEEVNSVLDLKKLIDVAFLQMDNDKRDKEVKSARMGLIRVAELGDQQELIEAIIEITKKGTPLARELAIRLQVLMISLKVARSYED